MQAEDVFTSLGGTEVCTTEKRCRNIKVMAGEEATAPRTLVLTLSPGPDLKAHANAGEANFTFSSGTALLFQVRWFSDSLGTGSVSVHDQHPQAETKRNPLCFNHREAQSLTRCSSSHRNQPAPMCHALIWKGTAQTKPLLPDISIKLGPHGVTPWGRFTNLIHTVSRPLFCFTFVSSLFFSPSFI